MVLDDDLWKVNLNKSKIKRYEKEGYFFLRMSSGKSGNILKRMLC